MQQIKLTKGKVAIIDDEDYDAVSKHKWCVAGTPNRLYAHRRQGKRMQMMHRFIMNLSPGQPIDHINRNGLDNRRSNLRVCTLSQNAMNCAKRPFNTSGYKGVYRSKSGKWFAMVEYQHKQYRCGTFSTKEEAAKAYNKKALELCGEYAYLNEV